MLLNHEQHDKHHAPEEEQAIAEQPSQSHLTCLNPNPISLV